MFLKTKDAAKRAGYSNSAGLLMAFSRHPDLFPNTKREGRQWFWAQEDIDAVAATERKRGWPAGKKRLTNEAQ